MALVWFCISIISLHKYGSVSDFVDHISNFLVQIPLNFPNQLFCGQYLDFIIVVFLKFSQPAVCFEKSLGQIKKMTKIHRKFLKLRTNSNKN